MRPGAIVRPETQDDVAAVRALHLAAFPTPAEADLVDRLRCDGDAELSLVAMADGRLTGHAMLSTMRAPFDALGLAPVAVAAGRRRQGIAAALIREGIRRATAQGRHAIFVVGDRAYYGRFGFSAEAAAGFTSHYSGPHFMVLALGARLPVTTGRVDYAPAFAGLE